MKKQNKKNPTGLKHYCLKSIVSGCIQWNWISKWFVNKPSINCFNNITVYIQYFSYSTQEIQSIDIAILIVTLTITLDHLYIYFFLFLRLLSMSPLCDLMCVLQLHEHWLPSLYFITFLIISQSCGQLTSWKSGGACEKAHFCLVVEAFITTFSWSNNKTLLVIGL